MGCHRMYSVGMVDFVSGNKPKGGLKLISGWTDVLKFRLTECFSFQSTSENVGAKMCEVMTKRADNNVKSKVKAKLSYGKQVVHFPMT